ncbi:MAG TPA: hypothetical protein ENG80_03255 [Nitrospirae bacterium]|nr:hypothetical protein [Nitrospirota bacterium]HDH04103.1 hypothetical protein [Nitrospirota bacterium]
MGRNNRNHIRTEDKTELANELKLAFSAVSPFIEKHTSIVCPACEKVCCIDKHGRYDNNDLVFLGPLGADISHNPSGREETDPCRFLDEKGCSRERWQRPFRCTFFFCDALLESLEDDNAKLYRAFTAFLQHLVYVRQKLLDYKETARAGTETQSIKGTK